MDLSALRCNASNRILGSRKRLFPAVYDGIKSLHKLDYLKSNADEGEYHDRRSL